MAAQAVFKCKMRLTLMAVAALRDILANRRRVPFMTIQAGHVCLMLTASVFNINRRLLVTLDTVIGGQHRSQSGFCGSK